MTGNNSLPGWRSLVWNILKVKNKTPEQPHWRRSTVFIVNFEQISYIVVVFPL